MGLPAFSAWVHAGEREPISLTKEKVKWVLPPGVHGSEEAASDSDAEHEDGEHARPSRRPACKRIRKPLASPGPDDGTRPHKAARLQVPETDFLTYAECNNSP